MSVVCDNNLSPNNSIAQKLLRPPDGTPCSFYHTSEKKTDERCSNDGTHQDIFTELPKTQLFVKYIESLSEKELKAYYIAKSHLGTSFSLEKSRGFLDWKNKIKTQS